MKTICKHAYPADLCRTCNPIAKEKANRIMTHAEKLKRIEALMASPDVIELDALTAEVEAFEKVTYQIEPPTIPEAMKFRREQMKENQREISMRAGMSLNRWKHLESGKNKPSIADARKLYAVGIPISVIFGENNPDHTVAANDMIAAVKGGADEIRR